MSDKFRTQFEGIRKSVEDYEEIVQMLNDSQKLIENTLTFGDPQKLRWLRQYVQIELLKVGMKINSEALTETLYGEGAR